MLNNIIPRLPLLNKLCWVQTLIVENKLQPKTNLSCSIIIPAYNEADNIEECIRRIPKFKTDYEIIVIDDGSTDATPLILERLQKEIPNLRKERAATNSGKAYAVQEGIRLATKEVIIILDADMSVLPEDLTLFVEPLERNIVSFVNGTRLIYNMEKNAMDQLKHIANFLLAVFFSLILRYRITDTLCGTKAFFRKDFQDINISEERWGDLTLIWAAKRKGLKIGEVPVRYYARKSGKSKMKFLKDGFRFIRYVIKVAITESWKTS